MASENHASSPIQEASAVERLLARWENKVEFVVVQAAFELSVGQNKSSVTERGDLVMQVRTHTSGVARKYPRGEVRLVPFDDKHDRDKSGEPIIGAITCIEGELRVGILLSKSALSDLVASGVCATANTGRRYHVALWPSSNMSSWNGDGQLWVKEATFVVQSSDEPKAT